MHLICFGQQNWSHCWTGKQQLLTRLARSGHRVLYVDPDPVPGDVVAGLASGIRLHPLQTGLTEHSPNLHIYTPHASRFLPKPLDAKVRKETLIRVARRMGFHRPVAFALRPDRLWLMRAVQPQALVYYAVDEWTGFGGLTPEGRSHFRNAEENLLRQVDLALGVSPRLVERFRALQPNTYHLENGSDTEAFSAARLAQASVHPAVAMLSAPRLGFIGQLDERLDVEMLCELMQARPQWNLVLAGRLKEGVDISALLALPNVTWLGYQPFNDLPGVLRGLDVCLVPYRQTLLTQSCNPLKVYDYLASGLPVVSVPLEGLKACREVVALAETTQQFIDRIEAALQDPQSGRDQRLAVARANSWDRRAQELEEYLEEAVQRARARRAETQSRQRARPPSKRIQLANLRLDAKEESVRTVNGGFDKGRLRMRSWLLHKTVHAAGVAYYFGRVSLRTMRRQPSPLVRRILVARQGFLGDTIVFLPTLHALRRRFPDAKIVVGVPPEEANSPLLKGCSAVDEVRVLGFMSTARSERWFGMARLFMDGFDIVITGVWYSMLSESLYSGAPLHVSLYDGHRLQTLSQRCHSVSPVTHEVDSNLALVEHLGAHATPEQRVRASSSTRRPSSRSTDRFFAAANLRRTRRSSSSIPARSARRAAGRPNVRAPHERLLAADPNRYVVLTGVPDEGELVERVRSFVPNICGRGRSRARAGPICSRWSASSIAAASW
jgi:glycosyltransferase involved in cell wall biosynthesis